MKKKINYNRVFKEKEEEKNLENQEIKKVEEDSNYEVLVSVKLLNHRKQPSLNSEVISQLEKGTKLIIVEEKKIKDVIWGKTTDGGWVVLSFCKRVD